MRSFLSDPLSEASRVVAPRFIEGALAQRRVGMQRSKQWLNCV